MKKTNFALLSVAREARGLTQAQLVEKIPNLTQGNYSKMEKGLLSVPTETLINVAESLNFPVTFFEIEKPIFNQPEYYYRKRKTMPRKEQITLEATFNILKLWIDELLQSVDIPEFRIPSVQVRQDNSPEDIARKVRTFLNIPKGPINELVKILEKNGVIVYFLNDAPEKFDGTVVITPSGQYVIVVNNSYPNDRKRFTIAHEFFHIISHLPFADYFNTDRDFDQEADRFASEFLMPENDIRRDLLGVKLSDLGDLKLYWKVSKAAIVRRAYTLHFIDKNKYTNMMIELSRSGERKNERLSVPIDEPRLLNLIVKAHLSDLNYTRQELENVLRISQNDFNQFFMGSIVSRLKIAI